MKKSPLLRNSVILALVIAILAGLVIFVVKFEPESDSTAPAATTVPSYNAYKAESADVESIIINNANSVMTVKRSGEKWTINDIPTNEISTEKVESLVSNIIVMISSIEIDKNNADLSEYGLDNPSASITVNLKDGTSDKMMIGSKSPVSGEYFLAVDGVDKIYSIYEYKVDSIQQDISYYQSFNRFSIDTSKVSEIILDRKNKADIHLKVKDVIDETSYNVWTMTAPYDGVLSAIDQYVDDKILLPLSELQISEPAPTGVNYGFDNPDAVITIVLAEYNEDGSIASTAEQKLIIGNTENHMSYVKLDSSDNVYTVSDSMLSFAYVDEFLVVSKLQGMADIADTSKVTVNAKGKSHIMEINHTENNKFTFKIDGKDAEEKMSKKMYQEIIALHVDGVYNNEMLKESEVKVTFTGYNGAEDTVIEYIPIDELSYAVRRNGKTQFTIKKLEVSKMLEKLEDYAENPAE